MFLELNSKGLHQSSGKEKESFCLLFPSSTKREIRQFRATTVEKCTKKRDARAKLLFDLSKPIAFLPLSLTSPSSLRSSLVFNGMKPIGNEKETGSS